MQNHDKMNRIRAASCREGRIRVASRREGHKGIKVSEDSCVSPEPY